MHAWKLCVFQSTTTTTITLELLDPAKPNGYIEHYNVYLSGQLVSAVLPAEFSMTNMTCHLFPLVI